MPKMKIPKTLGGRKIMVRAPSKFRIGSRKGGKSALLETTSKLLEFIKNVNNRKYRNNVVQVLHQRGIEISNFKDL